MDDNARYSCQVALPDFGKEAQEKLRNAKVLIIGMGGLGCPAAQYLVSSGVGMVGLADFDAIGVSNLHRQILYAANEVGQKKVTVAAKKLQAQNPQVKIITHNIKVSDKNIEQLIADYDLVIDATDNFETHYLINDACVMAKKPIVHGAIYQYEGHVAVWNMQNEDGSYSPNYRDVFADVDPTLIPDCADGGVLPTIAGIIGTMQANEAIKVITQSKYVLKSKMLVFDAQTMQNRIINLSTSTKTNITSLPLSTTITTLSKTQLIDRLKENNLLLVDVRTEGEHSAFNIGGKNIPLDILEGHLSQLKDNKEIVFYCASGKRSALAAKSTKEKLPEVMVSSLEGGINNW